MTDRSRDRAQDSAERRKAELAEHSESILDSVEDDLGTHEYPVTSEELATEYANEPIDMPNETESLGSVFDRLAGERYDSPEEVREAVTGELTGEAGDAHEANSERDLERLEEEKQGSLDDSGADHL